MKQLLTMVLVAAMVLSLSACASGGQTRSSGSSTSTSSSSVDITDIDPPDPNEDYTAYYEYLLALQSAGKIPFEDKLKATGEVTDAFSLTIDGKPFDNDVASQLTVYTATFELFTKVEGHTNSWVGYRFTEVCDLLGITLGDTVRLHATDGFSQAFDVKNIDDNTMIVITKDGDASDGPYFAPCTYLISANYTKYLSEISLP